MPATVLMVRRDLLLHDDLARPPRRSATGEGMSANVARRQRTPATVVFWMVDAVGDGRPCPSGCIVLVRARKCAWGPVAHAPVPKRELHHEQHRAGSPFPEEKASGGASSGCMKREPLATFDLGISPRGSRGKRRDERQVRTGGPRRARPWRRRRRDRGAVGTRPSRRCRRSRRSACGSRGSQDAAARASAISQVRSVAAVGRR